MEDMVGLRFLPTDEEIVDHYLRLKNHGGSNTSHVDQVISTLNICNFDPWDLPPQSRTVSSDQTWYFFGRKESRYNRGERQKRQTKSGFWKKTGVTLSIKRKRGNREKIGEKRVLVYYNNGSKSNWVMHEYHASCLSPNDSGTYTVCKVQFKGEASEISSSSGVHSHSLANPMSNPGGSEGLQSPSQFSGVLDHQQEMQFEPETEIDFEDLLRLLDDDGDDEQIKTASMQKSMTSVFIGHNSSDNYCNKMVLLCPFDQEEGSCFCKPRID